MKTNWVYNCFHNQTCLLIILLLVTSCASGEVKGKFLSSDKNIWIEDSSDKTLAYCLSNNADDLNTKPTCYRAIWGRPSSNRIRTSPPSIANTASTDEAPSKVTPAAALLPPAGLKAPSKEE